MQSEHFPRNTPFKPSSALVPWLIIDFLIVLVFVSSFVLVPLFLSESPEILFWVLGGLAALVLLFIIWTRLYYDSMWYELHDDEMRWKRGVIFRRTGIVPYNRITNIDIRQGPVMRAFDISTLSIQTAGYSGKAQAEIRIEAIVHAEELRELIRTMVRVSSGGDGTGTGGAVPARVIAPADLQQVLDEMRAIRALLEKKL
jgi:membrane protein YdbS with pleckstrin-like domain